MTSREKKTLLRAAPLCWPTIALAVASVLTWLISTTLALVGLLPWWAAIVLNTAAAFAGFTPMHDASHRSIARTRWINEVLGRLVSIPLLAPFTAFRWLHLEHHKHTNDAHRDPDLYSGQGPRWQLPLRWLTQDLHYYQRYFAAMGRRPVAERRETLATFAVFYGVIAALLAGGLLVPVLLLWMLPARLAIALLAFTFDYLPHRPHTITAAEDRYRATSVFTDAWLTPVMFYQNFHLVHHLYPGVPFYRYGVVWHAMEDELRAKGAMAYSLFEPVPVRSSSAPSEASASCC